MTFRNPFKHHDKQHKSDKQVKNATIDHNTPTQDAPKHAPSPTTTDTKELSTPPHHPPQPAEEALPPPYTTQAQPTPRPPRYHSLDTDPHDPDGVAYGYQWEESPQNFPHPSSVARAIGKPMTYTDPRAAELARRASQSGRHDLAEMMNYHLRQQELGRESVDNTIAAWNGI